MTTPSTTIAPTPHDVLSPEATRAVCGGLAFSTIWRMRQRGEFPEPVQLSPNRVGWRRADIDAWLAARPQAGSQQAQVPQARRRGRPRATQPAA